MVNKPTFLGVGMMKAATTWLSECLRYHPEVYISDVKEIHFFSRKWDKGSDWYYEHFEGATSEKVIGEFSNTYVDDIEFYHRIKQELGNIKILISLRDPLDRLMSHYKYNYRVYPEAKKLPIKDIDINTLEVIKEQFPEILTRGLYYETVRNCIDIFGKDNVYIGYKEDIDNNPENEVKRLYRFLEIDESFKPSILNKQVSPGSIPRIYLLEKLRVRIYQFMHAVFPKGIVWVRKFRIGELYRKLNKSNTVIQINADAKEWLGNYYKDDILKLERLTGRDLNQIWKSYPN